MSGYFFLTCPKCERAGRLPGLLCGAMQIVVLDNLREGVLVPDIYGALVMYFKAIVRPAAVRRRGRRSIRPAFPTLPAAIQERIRDSGSARTSTLDQLKQRTLPSLVLTLRPACRTGSPKLECGAESPIRNTPIRIPAPTFRTWSSGGRGHGPYHTPRVETEAPR